MLNDFFWTPHPRISLSIIRLHFIVVPMSPRSPIPRERPALHHARRDFADFAVPVRATANLKTIDSINSSSAGA